MTGSRADIVRRGPLIGFMAGMVCCMLLAAGDAWAQRPLDAPKSLAPRVQPLDPQVTSQPQPPLPSEPSNTGSVLPIGVESAPLSAIDPDSVGTLTREQGGFGFEMWTGTRRGVVETMLPEMPARTVSLTVRDMMRRLLLSNAKAPGSDAKKKSLIVLRVEQLAAMGDAAGVDALLGVAPTRGTDPALLRAEADMLFLESDNAKVCALVAGQSDTVSIAYWRKAEIFCQALAGEQDRAALGATLLREQGDKDRLFNELLDALSSANKPKLDSMATAQPLHFAMARAAKVALPADVATSNHPGILRMLATSPSLANDVRLDAAERAEAMGVIDTRLLRDIYAGIAFSKDQLDKALSTAQAERSAISRALLYRRAVGETVPTALAQIIQQALTLARTGGRYPTQARVYRELLSTVPPTRDLLWLAPEATRALLAAGDYAGVNSWLNILRASAVLDDKSAQMRDRLLPLARIAGAIKDEDWNDDAVGAWFNAASVSETNTQLDPEDVRAQAILIFNLLEALGDTVPEAQWERTVVGGAGSSVVPNAALWRQLNAASIAGRSAETVMLSSVAMGPGQLGEIDPTVLRFVIESLRGVGLTGEARSLAVEAAVSASI